MLLDSPDICHIIAEYAVPEELLDWISQEKLKWHHLSANPAAIYLLEANPVCYANDSLPRFLFTPGELRRRPQGFERGWNPLHPDKINWSRLSANPTKWAMDLLKMHPDKIDWNYLSANPTKWAMHLLESNPDKINWKILSENLAAIHLLEANPDKIDWNALSRNPAIFEIDKKKITELAQHLHSK